MQQAQEQRAIIGRRQTLMVFSRAEQSRQQQQAALKYRSVDKKRQGYNLLFWYLAFLQACTLILSKVSCSIHCKGGFCRSLVTLCDCLEFGGDDRRAGGDNIL